MEMKKLARECVTDSVINGLAIEISQYIFSFVSSARCSMLSKSSRKIHKNVELQYI